MNKIISKVKVPMALNAIFKVLHFWTDFKKNILKKFPCLI